MPPPTEDSEQNTLLQAEDTKPADECADNDVYLAFKGRVLGGSDAIGECGVEDGSTVRVTERLRSGGKHKDKKSKAERKQVAGQESVRDMVPAIPESEKDKMTQ